MQTTNKIVLALGGGIESATRKSEFANSAVEDDTRIEVVNDDGVSVLIAYINQERNCLNVIKWQIQMAVS